MGFVPMWARPSAVIGLRISLINAKYFTGLIDADTAKAELMKLEKAIEELPR